jgi:hypothetical protein
MLQEKIDKINTLKTIAECKDLELLAKKKSDNIFAKAIRERIYEISIDNLKSEQECDNFSKNSLKNNRPDLVVLINRKSIELFVQNYPGYTSLNTVEIASLKATYSYEKLLRLKNGKKTRATYTWRAIKNYGILKGIDRIVSIGKQTTGFNYLSTLGLTDYSFEALVLQYPNDFSTKAVEKAKVRIGSLAA